MEGHYDHHDITRLNNVLTYICENSSLFGYSWFIFNNRNARSSYTIILFSWVGNVTILYFAIFGSTCMIYSTILILISFSDSIIVGSYPLMFLTPLKLMVVLPPEYPSSAPPIFTLSSSWLNGDQLTALCLQLDMLWQECPSMPILNTWIDWLEHNTLR